jgi:hypothetical protein
MKKQKPKNIKLVLSAKDEKLLIKYCLSNKSTPKRAIKKILHDFLVENVEPIKTEAENQLELFKPKQMNIFD